MKKKIMAALLAGSMALGMSTTAFAAESLLTVFGETPELLEESHTQLGAYNFYRKEYQIFVDGATSIYKNDYTVNETGWTEEWWGNTDMYNADPDYEPGDELVLSSIEAAEWRGGAEIYLYKFVGDNGAVALRN